MTEPCPYMDPTCPCQDGDSCHYEDLPLEDVGSHSIQVTVDQQHAMAAEIRRLRTALALADDGPAL